MSDKYAWRRLSKEQRKEILGFRKERGYPWHSPPHLWEQGDTYVHVTAACYQHQPLIGLSPARMDDFTENLLGLLSNAASEICSWAVLPNHYHALVETAELDPLLAALGRFHGRTSYLWNGEENSRKRRVFYRACDRAIRSQRHFFATRNYIHHNPVHHGYVEKWADWPWSSAADYLAKVGKDEAEYVWREYPIRDFGKGWDDPGM